MKTKVMILIICGMLLTPVVAFANPLGTAVTKNTMLQQRASSSISQVDVPVWHVGDSWTYKIDNISIAFAQENSTFDLFLSIDTLPLTVESEVGSEYILGFTTTASGIGHVDGDFGSGPVKVNVSFKNIEIQGSVVVDKTQLGIKSVSADLNGRFRVDVLEQPYINLPIKRIPVPFDMSITAVFGSPTAILSFPMDTGNFWGITATNLTINGHVHSIWFNIIHFVNVIATAFGNPFLPPEIDAMLPIVDIKDAMTYFGISNVFQIPEVPAGLFQCGDLAPVTVPAGPFDAYNVTMAEGLGYYYYAPSAGNVIKIAGNLEQVIPYVQNIKMELLSTTYS